MIAGLLLGYFPSSPIVLVALFSLFGVPAGVMSLGFGQSEFGKVIKELDYGRTLFKQDELHEFVLENLVGRWDSNTHREN